MKNTIIISFLVILIVSCSKPDTDKGDIQKCDCSNYLPSSEAVECNGTISQSDSCQTYFAIWKELFLEKNNMKEDYFDTHITPCSTILHKVADGISFEIYFIVKVDWVEFRSYDTFIIWLSPSTGAMFPTLNIPRSVLLTKEQISNLFDNYAFSTRLSSVATLTSLKYSTRLEAMKALISASKVDTLCSSFLLYGPLNPKSSTSGHPYLRASGDINRSENKCIESQIDLVTGEVYVNYDACMIINK